MNPLEVRPDNVWQYKQNRPTLIAKDINELYSVPEFEVLQILMARGVFKWFTVRRNLIRLKDQWKEAVSAHQILTGYRKRAIREKGVHATNADHYRYGYLKGYRDALTECRREIRELCHSERWQCPDNDLEAWLKLEYGIRFPDDVESENTFSKGGVKCESY